MVDPLDRLPEFFSEIQTRMLAGRRAYGDKSFSKDPRELIEEVQQELLDVCGWSYVLYCRLAQMRDALRYVETSDAMPSPTTRAWEPLGRLVCYDRGRHAVNEPDDPMNHHHESSPQRAAESNGRAGATLDDCPRALACQNAIKHTPCDEPSPAIQFAQICILCRLADGFLDYFVAPELVSILRPFVEAVDSSMRRPTDTARRHGRRRSIYVLKKLRRRPLRMLRRLKLKPSKNDAVIRLHGVLDLLSNPIETRRQLGRLSSIVVPRGKTRRTRLRIDMSEVLEFDPCALVHLVAQVHDLTETGSFTVSGNVPKEASARYALQAAGFMPFIENRRVRSKRGEAALRLTRGHSLAKLDPEDWLPLHEFLESTGGLAGDALDTIYAAFGECVENVRQHAFRSRDGGYWYALAIRPYSNRPGRAVIADLGVGVASSLRQTRLERFKYNVLDVMSKFAAALELEDAAELLERARLDDWLCVYLATQGLRTESEKPERGTGLSGLRQAVVDGRQGMFHVLSGRTTVTWSCDTIPARSYYPPLRGTVVCLEFGCEAVDIGDRQ